MIQTVHANNLNYPQRIIRRIIFGLLVVLLSFNLAAANPINNAYNQAAEGYHRLLKDKQFAQQRSNWDRVVGQFKNVYQRYPTSQRATQSLYNIGVLYRSLYKWNQQTQILDQSIRNFQLLMQKYPKSYLVDDALLQIAEVYELKNFKTRAAETYQKLLQVHPKSEFVKTARQKTEQYKHLLKTTPKPIATTKKAARPKPTAVFNGLVLIGTINHWSTTDWMRVVINTKQEIQYKYQSLPRQDNKPERFYIDLLDSYILPEMKKNVASKDGIIDSLKIAQYNKTTTRIVLDLVSFDKIQVFDYQLPGQSKIVIDVLGKNAKLTPQAPPPDSSTTTQQQTTQQPKQQKPKLNQKLTLSKALGLKVRKIVLDAGHGGKDPGAIGLNKLYEKDVVLKLVKLLKVSIEKDRPDIQVVLTRNRDVFIDLEKRAAFANQQQADLFVSVHVNAHRDKNIAGVETFYLDFTDDTTALELAATENQSSLRKVSDLQQILQDLLNDSKEVESAKLATMVQNTMAEMVKKYESKNIGVKKAPFIVLLGTNMPSILVEAGFLTNQKENKLLRQISYLKQLSVSINHGIQKYINYIEQGNSG